MKEINRDYVLNKAVDECLAELYRKSTPSISWRKLKTGKLPDDKDNPYFQKCIIPADLYDEIVFKYKDAYNVFSDWLFHVELIENYLEKGGLIEKGKYEFDKLPPLKEIIGEEAYQKVMEYIAKCKDYYKLNSDEKKFDSALFFVAPTCDFNKEK